MGRRCQLWPLESTDGLIKNWFVRVRMPIVETSIRRSLNKSDTCAFNR